MIEFTEQDFTEIKEKGEALYKTINEIYKQIESGRKFFWSIIPFWGMNQETMGRILHDGEPEED